MRKILLTAMLLILLGFRISLAQNWYVINDEKCVPPYSADYYELFCQDAGKANSPAAFIRQLKEHAFELFGSVSASDVREGDKPVEVTVNWYDSQGRCSVTFYRLGRCKAKLIQYQQKEEREKKKLKEYE